MTATASWGRPRRRDRPAAATGPNDPGAAPTGGPDPEDVARLLARRRARRRAMGDTATTSEETPS